MKLLTKEIIGKLPAIKSTEEKDPEDIPVIVKYFTPWSNWTWYATEGEAVLDEAEEPTGDYLFFGYVVGFEKELGYFVLSELASVTSGLAATLRSSSTSMESQTDCLRFSESSSTDPMISSYSNSSYVA